MPVTMHLRFDAPPGWGRAFEDPQTVGAPMRRMLHRSGQTVMRRTQQNLRRTRRGRRPSSGRAAASVKYTVDVAPIPLWAKVFSSLYYVVFIERGTRPFFPRLTPQLRRWARQRGIDPWALAVSIAQKGTRRRAPFRRAMFASRRAIKLYAIQAGNEIAQLLGDDKGPTALRPGTIGLPEGDSVNT